MSAVAAIEWDGTDRSRGCALVGLGETPAHPRPRFGGGAIGTGAEERYAKNQGDAMGGARAAHV